MAVFALVKDKLQARNSITPFQQLIVSMKLRLAMPHEELTCRFQLSKATVFRVFNTSVDALYPILKLIIWPERRKSGLPTLPH